jgi:hypothetical protein
MARKYTEITKEEFFKKIKEIMPTSDEIEELEEIGIYDLEEFPWNIGEQKGTKAIAKDLQKVDFDFENCTSMEYPQNYSNYPSGYRELKPGFHVWFVNAGGDWEFPICFVIYWGDKLRAYIPKDGNAWNKKEKCAYGSEAYPTNKTDAQIEQEVSEEKIIADILNHITLK